MPSFLTNLTADQARVAVAAGIGVATVAGLAYVYKKHRDNTPPTKWRRVGKLSELICYPIKSCGPINLSNVDCAPIGLETGNLRDRIFMVTKANGEFITGRQHPQMTLVAPRFEGNKMILSAPDMKDDVIIDVDRLRNVPPIKCEVWEQSVDAVDCGDEVAAWLSRFILSQESGLRLVYYPGHAPTRDVRMKFRKFAAMSPRDTGAFHDSTGFMLFNEASVTDLNSRLRDPVQVLNFRPNFVVKGPAPYDEDTWKWVKIGDNAVFKYLKPCTRCMFTTVDPETGKFREDGNPIKTLNKYRIFKDIANIPCFGINMGVRVQGTVALGDAVYVGVN